MNYSGIVTFVFDYVQH